MIETGTTGLLLTGAMGLFAALLWTAVILSVFKPGGRTRWGRPKGERRRTPRTASTGAARPAPGVALAPPAGNV